MKRNFSLIVFMFILSLYLFTPKLIAESILPFPDLEPDISLDFKDASLKDILKLLSIQSGLNFIAGQNVQDRKMTLYLDKVPLREAMDDIFKANNLSYELDQDSNVFIVKDWGTPSIETITKIFYLKHATVSSSSLKEEMSNNLRAKGELGGGFGVGGGGGGGGGGGAGKWAQEPTSGLTAVVKKLLSDKGSLVEDYRTNSFIITEIPQNMEKITQVIASLDIPIPQIMLEVEMLDVNKNDIDRLGINYAHSGLGSAMFTATLTPATMGTALPFATSVLKTGRGTIAPSTSGKFSPLGASYTIDADFIAQMTDSKILARPRILTLNNEPAEIKIVTNEAVGSIQTITGGGAGIESSTTQAERIETGVLLRVTPQINVETGEITMVILPTVRDATVSTLTAFTGNTKDPQERSTKSVVKVRDGETVIIGGLISKEKSETVTKLPILGDIPFIGAAFRHKFKDKDKERELLVFITPRIVKDTASSKLTQIKKNPFLQREQSTTGPGREVAISSGLNKYENW